MSEQVSWLWVPFCILLMPLLNIYNIKVLKNKKYPRESDIELLLDALRIVSLIIFFKIAIHYGF